jgi:hypothetical protein
MSQSGQGIGTPPRACPFVALEDDRDRRASAPDPRHRCYAVATPQPRALAHQETYCLAAAFPSCTFFLDWAARAAANPVQTGMPAAASVTGNVPASRGDEALDPLGRPWATPPPWVAHPELTTTRPPTRPNEQISAFPDPSDHAFDHDLGVPDLPPRPPSQPQPAYPPIPTPQAAYQPPPLPQGYQPPAAGAPAPAAAQPDYQPAFTEAPGAYSPETWAKPSGPVDEEPFSPALPSDTALSGRLTGRAIDGGPPPRIDLQARPAKGKGKDGSSEWARPKRYEAYPTLGRRLRLRGISPAVLLVFAIGIGAIALLALPTILSGRGAGPAGSLSPSVVATLGEPTPTPGPTIQTYTVKSGDTLSGIARTFGVTAEQIACFNNRKVSSILSIKEVLRIPPADYTCPPKGGTPRPSASPKVSPSPH